MLQAASTPARDVPASTTSTSTGTRRMWPLVGSLAGISGVVATLLNDIHIATDNRDDMVTMDMVGQIDQQKAHFSIVAGFIAVALLIAFAAQWRGTVERRYPNSNAARIVPQAITAAAGALMLGYGWKGASAIYHADGMDHGTYDEMGLFIYYILNDFGSFIGWFGVTVAAGAVAWMSLRERIIPLWIGIFSLIPVLAVVAFTGATGLPGFPGVVSPVWMAVAFAGLALHGTFAAGSEE